MKKLNDPSEEKNAVAAANALYDSVKGMMTPQNLALQYDCGILLPIVRRHCTPEAYRAVLTDLCEVDPQLSVQGLDDRLLP